MTQLPPRQALPDRAALADLLDRAARVDASPQEVAHARQVVDRLFAAHQDRVYRVCLRYADDPQQAQDLAQDVFMTAYRRLGGYRGKGSFFSWLYSIAKWKAYNANARRRELLTEDGCLDDVDGSRGVFYELRRAERLAVLSAAAAAVLSPLEQEVVYLRYDRGLGQERIDQLLDLPGKSGARGVLQRCRRKLSRELRRRLQELGHGSSFFHESQW